MRDGMGSGKAVDAGGGLDVAYVLVPAAVFTWKLLKCHGSFWRSPMTAALAQATKEVKARVNFILETGVVFVW